MDLRHHLDHTPMPDLAASLEQLDGPARADLLLTLPRRTLLRLWDRAAASPPVQRDDLVPDDQPEGLGLRHHGLNSLPTARDFEKHFAAIGSTIVGFNEGPTRRTIGPGFFVCRPVHEGALRRRGAWVVDYHLTPVEVPRAWPPIVPTSKGLQRFVYYRTRDYLRKVCDGVLIGRAYRSFGPVEVDIGATFLLLRDR